MTRTLRTIAATAALALTLAASPALAENGWEEGAVFDEVNHVCTQDGVQGVTTFDKQCMTPADYDEVFSYENLSTVVSTRAVDNGATIAEVYEMEPPTADTPPPSERTLGEGVASEPFTFVSWVGEVWHKVEGGYLIQ